MSWRERLDGGPEPSGMPQRTLPPLPSLDDDTASIDLAEYHPWTLQRVRSRIGFMLDLRRYDGRSGLFQGWQLSYPHLAAIEYTGDEFISLDFGSRQFVVQGTGLLELVRQLQQGNVQTIMEYSKVLWPAPPHGPKIVSIRKIDGRAAAPPDA